jgi:hypothetical protein
MALVKAINLLKSFPGYLVAQYSESALNSLETLRPNTHWHISQNSARNAVGCLK